jgi:hypothetical protein
VTGLGGGDSDDDDDDDDGSRRRERGGNSSSGGSFAAWKNSLLKATRVELGYYGWVADAEVAKRSSRSLAKPAWKKLPLFSLRISN